MSAMLVGSVVCSVAFYCQRCGKIHVHNIPYFSGVKRFFLRCESCSHEQAEVFRQKRGHLEIRVSCVACGQEHIFSYSLAELRHMRLEKVYCGFDHFELGYIGSSRYIEEFLAFNQAAFEKIHPADGKNFIGKQQLLLEALNRVHDFAAAGEVACPCSSHEFIAQVCGNAVLLECSHCGSYAIISAESADDLKRLVCGAAIGFLAPTTINNLHAQMSTS